MPSPRSIQRTYYALLLGNTLAASLIWGINTIFLLDAGLSNLEAFAANAVFTAGMVLFEVPTGIVADTVGRRASYLIGTVVLAGATLLYVLLWQMEARLLALGRRLGPARPRLHVLLRRDRGVARRRAQGDGLHRRPRRGVRPRPGRHGRRDAPGSVAGGFLAEATTLGVPFVGRAVILGLTFVLAWRLMHDVGFTPEQRRPAARRDAQDRVRVDRLRLARARR